MDERVKVRITARQEVVYDQIKTIRKADYDRYLQMVEDEASDEDFNKLAEMIIDPFEGVSDSEDFEDVEIRPFPPSPSVSAQHQQGE